MNESLKIMADAILKQKKDDWEQNDGVTGDVLKSTASPDRGGGGVG